MKAVLIGLGSVGRGIAEMIATKESRYHDYRYCGFKERLHLQRRPRYNGGARKKEKDRGLRGPIDWRH